MNDEDYFSDPDYDDFEFRELHPYVYGDDEEEEYEEEYDCRFHQQAQWSYRPTTESDELFHYEYLAWKARNKERIERLNQPSEPKLRPQEDNDLGYLIITICILAFVAIIFAGLCACV